MEPITVNIPLGKRQYKIKIAPEHEARVRELIEQIQETNKTLRQQFPGRDEQDYLAMTLIDFVSKSETPVATDPKATAIHESLTRIDQLLEP